MFAGVFDTGDVSVIVRAQSHGLGKVPAWKAADWAMIRAQDAARERARRALASSPRPAREYSAMGRQLADLLG